MRQKAVTEIFPERRWMARELPRHSSRDWLGLLLGRDNWIGLGRSLLRGRRASRSLLRRRRDLGFVLLGGVRAQRLALVLILVLVHLE